MINMMKVMTNQDGLQHVHSHQNNYKLDYFRHNNSSHFELIQFLVNEDEDHYFYIILITN